MDNEDAGKLTPSQTISGLQTYRTLSPAEEQDIQKMIDGIDFQAFCQLIRRFNINLSKSESQ